MAKLIPSIERIKEARQKPTEGELYLLNYLEEKFDPDAEVFFQPCVNGDRPDIVIIKKGVGLIVVEVKDWDLANYSVDENNRWRAKKQDQPVKRPSEQAFRYKKTFFDLHINGLLQKALENKNFFKLIEVFVYFHHADKRALEALYSPAVAAWKTRLKENEQAFARDERTFERYERDRIFFSDKLYRLERDSQSVAVTQESLKRIRFRSARESVLFSEEIQDEFRRVLAPPFHYANEGEQITLSKKQEELTKSTDGARVKISGVAGSGKTCVLARRAIDAHRRHGGGVLILTYNITLRMYIRDQLSAVREDFSWSHFLYTNYHRFVKCALENAGVELSPPSSEERRSKDAYFEEEYFSNVDLFERLHRLARSDDAVYDRKSMIKYETILVDEVQDYRPEWLKIIGKYFLAPGGEFVVFGDENQNIYRRSVDVDKKVRMPRGFGEWKKLTKSFRNADNSHVTRIAEAFQRLFLSDAYGVSDGQFQPSLTMIGINAWSDYADADYSSMVKRIIEIAKDNQIHPNDIAILGAQKKDLQELDFLIRNGETHRERTITTFEPKEATTNPVYEDHLRDVEASRKFGFNLNSGVMKVATTHSFKGFESPTVALLVGEHDSPEIVYTGLTRARENLIVFTHKNSSYRGFFESSLDPLRKVEQLAAPFHFVSGAW